jgi:phosphoribosylformylglycinamidine cyclo-ligase
MPSISYREAGVDIDAGDDLVERIKPFARATRTAEVLADVGGFAGLCAVPKDIEEPILVSGTDGVGTKLKVAFLTGVHDTIGFDLVGMCVNDIITCGARPLFFLDYFATGKLDVGVAERVVKGIAEACKESGCALLGGETAELPGMYAEGEYDLAGFAVGVVGRSKIVDGKRASAGDRIIGVASSGLHSNGYSLARRVIFDAMKLGKDERPAKLGGKSVAEALLAPTRLYARHVQAVLRAGADVRAMSHITGGGLPGNLPRVLPDGLGAWLGAAWKRPAILDLVAERVEEHELRRVFNLGVGFVFVVAAEHAARTIEALRAEGEQPIDLGEKKLRARVGVVLSNVATAKALDRARAAGVETAVVDHKAFTSREAFDAAVVETLRAREVSCVVLAGFMRLITRVLLDAFPQRVVNIHPALLPAFPGIHGPRQALAYGVRVAGCTVHLVDAGMDTGPILAQSAVPVLDDDDEDKLAARILEKEHELLPTVLQWIADDRVEVIAPSNEKERPRIRVRPA